jgi:uncharacterized membrane protein YfcA
LHHPSAFTDFCAGTVIGLISALVGIGGGTLTVPYLAYCHYPMRNAVAIASACGLPIALAGTASYVLLGQKAVGLPEWCIGYVYLPWFLLWASQAFSPHPSAQNWRIACPPSN